MKKINIKEIIENRHLSKTQKRKLREKEYILNRIKEHKERINTRYDLDEKGHACNIKVMTRQIARRMAKANPNYNGISNKYSKRVRKSLAIRQAFDEIYKPLNMSGYHEK